MHCEIEFLPVGSGSKAGDAIVLRYGYDNDFRLMLVDGGTAETGDFIVEHLRKNFGQQVWLEHVVLTHSDADHASGLRTVLKEIPVENIWLHLPWLLAPEAISLFADKRWTPDGLTAAIKKEYDIISEIYDLATTAGCKCWYPFQGDTIGPFQILSPSRYAYLHLLPQFEKTPDPDQKAIEAADLWIGKATWIDRMVEQAKAAIQSFTQETWEVERLKDGGLTSASNESSVVLYGAFDDNRRVLLTGDAGVHGLTWAANCANASGLPLQRFTFVQVPHHGSRRNVGPTILNRIVGPIQPKGSAPHFSAYISAPADDSTHPRKIVVNAFTRRGGLPIATQGETRVHWGGFSPRQGYVNVDALPFYTTVEEYT